MGCKIRMTYLEKGEKRLAEYLGKVWNYCGANLMRTL
jgi:hypothetical protein